MRNHNIIKSTIKRNEAQTKHYETKTLNNYHWVLFVLVIYCWAWGLHLHVVYKSSEIWLEKIHFWVASSFQLEEASGLGTGACVLLDLEVPLSLVSSIPFFFYNHSAFQVCRRNLMKIFHLGLNITRSLTTVGENSSDDGWGRHWSIRFNRLLLWLIFIVIFLQQNNNILIFFLGPKLIQLQVLGHLTSARHVFHSME